MSQPGDHVRQVYLAKDAEHGIGRSSWLMKTAVVDSGASMTLFEDEQGMVNVKDSRNVFQGISGAVKGTVDGDVHTWVYDPDCVDRGCGVILHGTAVSTCHRSLISVYQMCEKHGFTQITRPSWRGSSEFVWTLTIVCGSRWEMTTS